MIGGLSLEPVSTSVKMRVPTTMRPRAVDNMLPGQRFVRTLSASPIAPGVTVNSIVAVLGKGPISGLGDGVVMYKSAHLEGVGTEVVVHSGHSTQAVPETIEEVRRILREQVARR
jgi:hypothetical protein